MSVVQRRSSVDLNNKNEKPDTNDKENEMRRHEYNVLYLLACLTMGVDLVIPLYKAAAANSKCLSTNGCYNADIELKDYFRRFVAFLASENGNGCLVRNRNAPESSKCSIFFNAANVSDFDVHLFPTIVTNVIRPLDALRRSMQSVIGHPQLYISGKSAAAQPLLCRALGITHILRCVALPQVHSIVAKSTSPSAAYSSSPIDLHNERHNAGLQLPNHLPTDTAILHAALQRGGEWLTVPLTPNSSGDVGTRTTGIYHYDSLEYPTGMVSGLLNAENDTAERAKRSLPTTMADVYRVQRMTIPAVDDDTYDISQHFSPEVFTFISQAIASGGRILVHCAAGKHRSAAIICAYLIDLQVPERVGIGEWHGTSLPPSPVAIVERAFAAIKAARPMAETTPSYQRQLESFAAKVLSQQRQ